MSDDRLDEILDRLSALERMAAEMEREDRDGGRRESRHFDDRDRGRDRDRDWDRHERHRESRDGGTWPAFDERRIVDLIVGLVAEHVERIVDQKLAQYLAADATAEEEPQPAE